MSSNNIPTGYPDPGMILQERPKTDLTLNQVLLQAWLFIDQEGDSFLQFLENEFGAINEEQIEEIIEKQKDKYFNE